MANLDTLPGDQRAVLSLVLGRGRSYADIATMLSIGPDAVSGRALSALDALGPPTSATDAARQAICDYLLGQLSDDEAAAVRARLAGSAPERAWARVLTVELTPLARDPLPEIPRESAPPAVVAPEPAAPLPASAPSRPAVSTPPASSAAPSGLPSDPPQPQALPGRAPDGTENPKRSSRRGGAAVLVVVAIVIAAIVVLATRSHHHPASPSARATTTNPAAGSTSTTTTSSSSAAASATPIAQINLNPTASGSKATAIADVFANGGQREVAIIGQDIPANTTHNAYEVWLYNSPGDALALGFVNPAVTSTGKLSVGAPLPSTAARYHQIIVTTETARKPTRPGPILLAGTISGL
jgi:hypothetical protein